MSLGETAGKHHKLEITKVSDVPERGVITVEGYLDGQEFDFSMKEVEAKTLLFDGHQEYINHRIVSSVLDQRHTEAALRADKRIAVGTYSVESLFD
jgi:hypothetical protein